MKKLRHVVVALFLFQSVYAQTTLYNLNTIQRIEITFMQPNWDDQLDTAKNGFDSYILASKIKINGVEFDSAGVKYKGNSSYDATYKKNPLHIELDTYKNQSYQGIKDIKLGNCFADPSMIREVLSYDILKNYMDCPRSNFAQVFINGVYIGLYANDESITKSFCSDHFYSSKNTFVKCNPIVTPSSNTKSSLKYITADSTAYFKYYEMKSNNGWKGLVALCDTITNYPASIPSILDLDKAIWMLAFNSAMLNLDSYNGVFAQNYYLYKDNTNRFDPIVWDLNMSLGGFPYVGNSNSSLSGLTVVEMQKLSVTSHAADQYWPLIKNVLSNAMYKKMYIAHMRTIVDEMFVSNYYQTKASQLKSIIDTAVVADTNKFYTTAQYQNAMTTAVPNGSFEIPGINTLVDGRVAYLKSTADFINTQPVITAVKPNDTIPALNAPIAITANVTNTNTSSVYIGYRFTKTDKFIQVQMMDNGSNNDGTAGDNVYGAKLTMNGPQMQYYIYAENANSGVFSPERAEHEFYILKSDTKTADSGKVVINEFIASNKTGQLNEKGKYEDWIELYNTTSSPLDLDGLHLTDNYATPAKFTFPINTIIQPHGYLLVWADENATTTSYVHCNFKLSASGEQLMLTDATDKVLDSVTFGAQPDDVAMARCPNGSGALVPALPTFNTSNCANGIYEDDDQQAILVYPNPANATVTVEFNTGKQPNLITIFDVLGQALGHIYSISKSETINITNLSPGLYFIRVNQHQFQKIEVVH
jgi:spore coat protein CotH